MTNKKSIKEAMDVFMSEHKKPSVDLDWWMYDDMEGVAFNIHNHGRDDIDMFDVDVYPYTEGQDKPDYTKWNTVKTFSFKGYKNKSTKWKTAYEDVT